MKIAVITGASSGMGKVFVKRISETESLDEIWVLARSADKLNELQKEVKTKLKVIAADLTKEQSLQEYKSLLEAEKPDIVTLVNASGFGKFGAFTDIPLDEQLNMIDLNDKALVAMTYLSLPYINKGGKVYQLCSLSSFQPVPYINTYAATKAFVLSFSRGLNRELKTKGIRVMAVSPGWVRTAFFDRAATDDTITYFNRYYTPEQVVERALKDMKKGKDISICGFPVRSQVRLTKLLPHKWVMNIWCKQQKKK